MEAEIYYFSGTGNSLAVARDIAKRSPEPPAAGEYRENVCCQSKLKFAGKTLKNQSKHGPSHNIHFQGRRPCRHRQHHQITKSETEKSECRRSSGSIPGNFRHPASEFYF